MNSLAASLAKGDPKWLKSGKKEKISTKLTKVLEDMICMVNSNQKGLSESKLPLYRQLSGAMIRISNCEDRDAPANLDRTITITGNAESVALAQYLINMR